MPVIAYRSAYGDLTKLKDDSLLADPAGGAGDDAELLQLLTDISDWTDHYCNRSFAPVTKTLLFDGPQDQALHIPDLISITTLKADHDEDKTFEVTWTAATDWWTWPYNAAPTTSWGAPYTQIRCRSHGTNVFQSIVQGYQIAGIWGYRQHKQLSGSLLDEAGNITATQTTATVDAGTDFAIGQTIMIDDEQMLVTGIAAAVLTIVRALNGTTGAIHLDNAIVYILGWPPAVERATLMNAARIWTRAPAFEPFYVDSDLDTDVRALLDGYRRVIV